MYRSFVSVSFASLFFACLTIVASIANADTPAPQIQSWDIEYLDHDRGLSPTYPAAAKRLHEIIDEAPALTLLPRGIADIQITQNGLPCFTMNMHNSYYRNDDIIRWAAEQKNDDEFRLFYNSTITSRSRDNSRFSIRYGFGGKGMFNGKEWGTYSPPGGARIIASADLGDGSAMVLLSAGLYKYKDRRWYPQNFEEDDIAWQGVVKNPNGGCLAWSRPDAKTRKTTFAVYDGQKWKLHSLENVTSSNFLFLENGTMVCQTGGALIYAADKGFQLITLPSQAVAKTIVSPEQNALYIFSQGTDGTLSFAKVELPSQKMSVASHTPQSGEPESQPPSPGPQSVSGPQLMLRPRGGVVVSVQGSVKTPEGCGLFWTDFKSEVVHRVALPRMLASMTFLGCDKHDLAYFQCGKTRWQSEASFVAVSINPKSRLNMIPFEQVELSESLDPSRVVVNVLGCLFVESSGKLMLWKSPEKDPIIFDDRLSDVTRLAAGRDSAVLVIRKAGAALIRPNRPILMAGSLAKLLRDHFSEMHDAAPRNPCDARRFPVGSLGWMTTGKAVWYADDSNTVWRVASKNDLPNKMAENSQLAGMLADGTLLLTNARLRPTPNRPYLGAASRGEINKWYWIIDPDGTAKVEQVETPPAKQDCGHLERPAEFTGYWMTTQDGTFYATQGFDRAYKLQKKSEWSMSRYGSPRLEYPANTMWSFISSRTFNGYEVITTKGARRPSIPTYLLPLTPFAGSDDTILCMTPTGLAEFPIGAGEDAEVRCRTVNTSTSLKSYLGRKGEWLYFLTQRGRLVAVQR